MDNGCSLVVEERLLAQGCLVFGLGTLPNIRFRQCFQDIAYELCGKSGFLELQLSHKTKNSSSEINLPSYASNSISLVSRKDIFYKGFLKLSRKVSKGLPSRKKLFA